MIGMRLSHKSEQVMDHLIKIFMFPNHESAEHWKGEIHGFLSRTDKLKHNKKFPSAKFIFQNTWEICGDTVLEAIPAFEYDYGSKTANSYSEIESAVRDYFIWMSKELSNTGRLTKLGIKQEIDSIIKKYQFV